MLWYSNALMTFGGFTKNGLKWSRIKSILCTSGWQPESHCSWYKFHSSGCWGRTVKDHHRQPSAADTSVMCPRPISICRNVMSPLRLATMKGPLNQTLTCWVHSWAITHPWAPWHEFWSDRAAVLPPRREVAAGDTWTSSERPDSLNSRNPGKSHQELQINRRTIMLLCWEGGVYTVCITEMVIYTPENFYTCTLYCALYHIGHAEHIIVNPVDC